MSVIEKLIALADEVDALGEHELAEEITGLAVICAAPENMSKAEEKYWKEAEDIVKEEYKPGKNPDKFYGTVTNIFKAKVEKHLGHDPFKKRKKKKKKSKDNK